MLKFALAGNPNCGKTTLFNTLTGSTAHVGNWPGVTVDKKEGVYKKLEEHIEIVDLPGIYSLSPYTPEEVISRNFILDEKPDCVINIIDATNLERNLYLTTQIMEIDVPMVIALNMMDVVAKTGDKIDAVTLENNLGIPVVEISALKATGVDELMSKAYSICKVKRVGKTVLNDSALKHLIGDVKIALDGQGVENPLFHAVKLVECDELEVKAHPNTVKMVEEFKKSFDDKIFGTDFEALVADSRYKYITKNYSSVLTRKIDDVKREKRSDKIDRILTNKWAGIPIFLVVLFTIFHLTFSEDFLFLSTFINPEWVSLEGTFFEGFFGEGAINSPGVLLFNLMDLITSTISGWIVAGLEAIGSPAWVLGFFSEGLLGGLCGVLSFVPQIVFLLLLLSILEDTGYMARVAFILDRILRRFGVSGRAFIPMIMGFGCSIPAMINTRTLVDERERTLTIRVIPFFTCGAKVPILAGVAGSIVMAFGFSNADIITFSMYAIGLFIAVVTIILMRSTTQRGEVAPFIMELPAYHMPSFANLMNLLWDKVKHYIEKVFTVILASCIVIWFLSNFGWNWQMVEIDKSILASLGSFIQPIFTPLGFGSQLATFGWVFAVAAVMGLIAKENVLAAFLTIASVILALASSNSLVLANPDVLTPEILAGLENVIASGEFSEEGYEVVAMIAATGITWQGLIAFIVFNMSTIPCFAAVATARGELGKGKFKWTLLFWLATSYIASSVTYLVLTWWWTSFIFLAVLVVVILIVNIWNKKHPIKG